MKALLVLAVLALSGATLAAPPPFALRPGAQWPPSGVMTLERATAIAYGQAFAVKVELLVAIGGDFFTACQTAKVTAAIGIPGASFAPAVDELQTTWRYGMLLWSWQGGWEPVKP